MTSHITLGKRKSLLWPSLEMKKKNLQSSSMSTPFSPPSAQKLQPPQNVTWAPSKESEPVTSKKKLPFGDISQEEECIDRINELTTKLVRRLNAGGILYPFMTLLEVIADGSFDLENIALLLCLERAKLHHLNSTTQMTFSNKTMTFWKVFYRLGHGLIYRLMAGMRNLGSIVSHQTTRGYYDPAKCKSNFAPPSLQQLRKFKSDLPSEIPPGIISHSLDLIANNDKEYVLAVDGKKVSQGLNAKYGDIDLWGHEKSPTLKESESRRDAEVAYFKECEQMQEVFRNTGGDAMKKQLVDKTIQAVNIISKRIQQIRGIICGQKSLLKKLNKLQETTHEKDKYRNAISKVGATIFECDAFVRSALSHNFSLSKYVSCLKGTNTMTNQKVINPTSQPNLVALKEVEWLNDELKAVPAYIKQGSDHWKKLRRSVNITGSSMYRGLGIRSLKEQAKHIEWLKQKEEAPDTEAFRYGRLKEKNAVATLVGTFMPMFCDKDDTFVEDGANFIKGPDDKPLIEVSSDGTIRHRCGNNVSDEIKYVIEIKCPLQNDIDFKLPVQYELPSYYVLQILAEMKAHSCSKALFVSHSPESTVIHLVENDTQLWAKVEEEVCGMYSTASPKARVRVSDNLKEIRTGIKSFIKTNVTIIGEFPSLTMMDVERLNDASPSSPFLFSPYVDETQGDEIQDLHQQSLALVEHAHLLARRKASEVLAFVLSDTDREYNPEMHHQLPVAYAMKGYSLPGNVVRDMCDEVKQSCHEKGINVICESYDGQWASLVVKDAEGKPLNRLELQKQVWRESDKMTKAQQVSFFKGLYETKGQLTELSIARNENSVSVSSNDGKLDKIKTTTNPKLWQKTGTKSKRSKHEACDVRHDQTENDQTLQEEIIEASISHDQGENHIDDFLGIISNESDNDVVDVVDPIFYFDSAMINDPTKYASMGLSEQEVNAIRELIASDISDHEILVVDEEEELIQDINGNPAWRSDDDNVSYDTIDLDDDDLKNIKRILSEEKEKNRRKKNMPTDIDVMEFFKSATCVNNTLTHSCMNSIYELLSPKYPKQMKPFGLKWLKYKKVNFLTQVLGKSKSRVPWSGKNLKNVPSLMKQAAMKISGKHYPKKVLTAAIATYIFRVKEEEWKRNSRMPMLCHIPELDRDIEFFSTIEFNEKRGKMEPKIIDPSHLLTNLRSRISSFGLDGISKYAWHRVCEEDEKILSIPLVKDMIDKQDVEYAIRFFSREAEAMMVKNGDLKEAEFVHLIRDWYEAIDEAGMPAVERITKLLALRDYLLNGLDFAEFPPKGAFIKGLSQVSFAGFVMNVETRIQLYLLSKHHTYNHRSLGTLGVESFFGDMTDMCPTGCPRSVDLPKLISEVTELNKYRLTPQSRCFIMHTKSSSVYPTQEIEENCDQDEEHNATREKSCEMNDGEEVQVNVGIDEDEEHGSTGENAYEGDDGDEMQVDMEIGTIHLR